jgi:hypothetical protein
MQFKSILAVFLGSLLMLCLASSVALAQAPTVWDNCPERGIKTNPKDPVNPIDPIQANTFHWQNREFPFNGMVSNTIQSPFWQEHNNLAEPLRNSQDQYNSEGWELITKGFGFLANGQPAPIKETIPYYILYNKYTGIMRVFMAGVSQGRPIPYNAYQISIKFGDNSHQSSLLMLANEPAAIFDKFIRGQNFVSGTNFNTYGMLWVYADFPMTYDPCACNFKSRLYVELKLITKSQIRMVGVSQGTLTSVDDGKGEINQKESKWTLQNAIGAGKKASQTYNNVNYGYRIFAFRRISRLN